VEFDAELDQKGLKMPANLEGESALSGGSKAALLPAQPPPFSDLFDLDLDDIIMAL
jgi:hypothetical protein